MESTDTVRRRQAASWSLTGSGRALNLGSMRGLPPAAVAQYRRDGFYFPMRVLSAEEAAGYRARLEAVERQRGGPPGGGLRHQSHLLFTRLDALIRHPRILDAVEDG